MGSAAGGGRREEGSEAAIYESSVSTSAAHASSSSRGIWRSPLAPSPSLQTPSGCGVKMPGAEWARQAVLSDHRLFLSSICPPQSFWHVYASDIAELSHSQKSPQALTHSRLHAWTHARTHIRTHALTFRPRTGNRPPPPGHSWHRRERSSRSLRYA